MIAARLAMIAVLATACTVEHQVFGDDEPLTTCAAVWLTGSAGDPCELAAPCARDAPSDPMCCTQYAYCRMGELVMDTTCNPDCSTCVDDTFCAPGAAVCNGMTCAPCVIDPSGSMCEPCPPGWTTLTRNGCPTCECAPPNECDSSDGTVCGGGDPNTEQCYLGARFASPLCSPDDIGCYASVCSAPGCQGPAPLGCFTACDATNPSCGMCATDACECDPATGDWTCQQICIDQYPQALTCFH